jgi:mono/diheme cytochrome c family protein
MDPVTNSILGLLFFLIALGSTLLMFHLWSYPFDHVTHTSAAPAGLMRLHRFLGYAYFGIYVTLMTQMVPRLWSYQVEFPARTVAHLMLGMAIGMILLIKIAIVRFFKHLESSTVPFLGILLLVSTTLLIGLSAPFALQEEFLSRSAYGGQSVFAPDNLARVRSLLELAGVGNPQQRDLLTRPSTLRAGRLVLSRKCVQCHDVRTILSRPQPPESWRRVVGRMAERSVILDRITEPEELAVTAYLIAVSPQLRQPVQQQRADALAAEKARAAAASLSPDASSALPSPGRRAAQVPARAQPLKASRAVDLSRARQVYETKCIQCHSLQVVEAAPPASEAQARELVARMVMNGLRASEEELDLIVRHLLTLAAQR